MSNVESCLVRKFSHYIDLKDSDKKLLARLEEKQEDFKKRTVIRHPGDNAQNLFVVKRGWVCSYTILKDGSRHVDGIYTCGDIIGAMGIPFESSISGISAITDTTVCPFPKKSLNIIFEKSPRITSLIYSLGMQENVILLDRLRSLGKLAADARIALLLLQMQARVSISQNAKIDHDSGFEFYLNQEFIADVTGMTKVHVSRTFKKLIEEGFIEKLGNTIKLVREKDLIQMAGFKDRYYEIDTSWFPEK